MSFAAFDSKRSGAPMAAINMVPLIDVMLVLLVIFIVTAPLLTQAVKLELPVANAQDNPRPRERIEFAIDAAGQRFWNGEAVSRDEAVRRFMQAGSATQTPEIQLRADRNAAYHHVAETLADASRAGLARIGFVSEPEP